MNFNRSIPFSESVVFLLECIYRALDYCCELDDSRKAIHQDDPTLIGCFDFKSPNFPYKAIGLNNHINSHRMAKLTAQAFNRAQKLSDKKMISHARFLPAPLNILLSSLTVPEEPYTKAYALAACRSYLFFEVRCYPESYLCPKETECFSVQEIEAEYESLIKYKKKRDNAPSKDKLDHIVLTNFLSMKGVYHLRFGSDNKTALKVTDTKRARREYCQAKKIFNRNSDVKGINPEFRLADSFDDISPYSEIFNQLWGIPVSIRGFSTLFHGAVRTASKGGLVVSVSGSPGTGKTSFSLAFANALSGMGAACYYISVEEEAEDLQTKLTSLIPAYYRKLSLYRANSDTWFYPEKINISDFSLETFKTKHIEKIRTLIDKNKLESKGKVPALCPLIVVVDSLTGFLDTFDGTVDYKELESFVSACRELNVVVVLLSSDEISAYRNIEYLVDTVITLKLKNTDALSTKPRRVFELLKTRKQSSRPGSHMFHIEGDKGFRISPQLPSQLDKKQNNKRVLPNEESLIHAFNIWDEKGTKVLSNSPQYDYLTIQESSQILLHGVGSTGKAALGLKILTMPAIKKGKRPRVPNRALIISFLYPSDYYSSLNTDLNRLRKTIYPRVPNTVIDCMSFYPGYLTPEDFVGKITRAIEVAELEGFPYTGVLIDGVHNVFLQFPSLQQSDMVWPMLYNVLARSGLTTVTTFTTFAVNDYAGAIGDQSALNLERHVPFLHAMVQASDYLIRVQKTENGKNRIIVETTISQFKHPDLEVFWNSQNHTIYATNTTKAIVQTKELKELKEETKKDLFGG